MSGEIQTLLIASPALAPYHSRSADDDVQVLAGWTELFAASSTVGPSAVVVVDCSPVAFDRVLRDNLDRLRREHPSISLVAALTLGNTSAATLRELQGYGVSDVVDLELENSPELAGFRLREAAGRPFRRRVEASLSSYLSADARQLLRAVVEITLTGGSATELARLFGVSQVTVAKWCASAGLPFPRTLQVWMRLLLAAFLLGEPQRRIAWIAVTCGYSSDRSLRRALTRLAGANSRDLRGAAAFTTVANAFNSALSDAREKQRAESRRTRGRG